jgi:hypothetical protein
MATPAHPRDTGDSRVLATLTITAAALAVTAGVALNERHAARGPVARSEGPAQPPGTRHDASAAASQRPWSDRPLPADAAAVVGQPGGVPPSVEYWPSF